MGLLDRLKKFLKPILPKPSEKELPVHTIDTIAKDTPKGWTAKKEAQRQAEDLLKPPLFDTKREKKDWSARALSFYKGARKMAFEHKATGAQIRKINKMDKGKLFAIAEKDPGFITAYYRYPGDEYEDEGDYEMDDPVQALIDKYESLYGEIQ